jgi:di/tricarboxylate transporter
LQQRGLAALALAVLSLLAMLLIGNLQRAATVAAVALVVAVVAVVLAFSSLRAAKRAGTRRPRGAMPGAVLGVIGLLFTGLALLGFLLFGPQITSYGNCVDQASTSAEKTACQHELNNSIDNRIGLTGQK